MNTEVRRLATLAYLGTCELPGGATVRLRAGTVAAIVRALFAEERRADQAEQLRREDRLDAAERLSELVFAEAGGSPADAATALPERQERKQAGPRPSHRSGPTALMQPTACHPGVQRNLRFTSARVPPPSSFGLPPTGEGR